MARPPSADLPENEAHADLVASWNGQAERRRCARWPAEPGVRLEVRRWDDELGPDIASRLIDVSADGIRVQLPTEPAIADVFEVTLWDAVGVQRGRVLAGVRWWRCELDGDVTAGLVFEHVLSSAAVSALSEEVG